MSNAETFKTWYKRNRPENDTHLFDLILLEELANYGDPILKCYDRSFIEIHFEDKSTCKINTHDGSIL
jgi:hypothetical protein